MTKRINETSPYLQRLKELTPELRFPEIISSGKGFTEHNMKCGTSLSTSLLNKKEISCAEWFNSTGSKFPDHIHDERLWLIIYRGSMKVTIKGQEPKILRVGEYVVIEPRVIHQTEFLEDCFYIAITIPCCDDWPSV